ncbi:MAG TPA: cellulase family glycosylhydrolase [Bacillota bacterium]|nr:cellulase family glycosylhydrolase [Bacillota bacterium]
MKIRCLKLFLIILILVMCLTTISTAAMANSKYGRLTGVNWYGFETGNLVPHGLWARDYKSMLQQIKDLGFNCIRLPWCVDVLTGTPESIQINAYAVDAYTGKTGMNLDLEGLNSMQVMDKIVDYANTLGLKIILDCHSIIHDNYMNETLWYTTTTTESVWINAWKTLVTRYKNYPNLIGCDLKNEPHGSLGQGMKPPATWGYDCQGYTTPTGKPPLNGAARRSLPLIPIW